MKPLTNVESFMKSMNKTHGTYTCIVLDNLEMLSQNLYSIIHKNLKRKNIFDQPIVTILCGDSFDSGNHYYIKEIEGDNKRTIEFVVAELTNSIPTDAEYIFVEMHFDHLGSFWSDTLRNRIRLVMYQRP